jgi:hypothetical protein
MTRDDIIRMAREADLLVTADLPEDSPFVADIARFAHLIKQHLIEQGYRQCAEGQRDALLEACRAMLTFIERHAPRGLQPEPGSPVAMARAAIKAVEENT